jgi:transcriptional antiterminator RfaH
MKSEEPRTNPSWHLVHTHPRQEARAEQNLRNLRIETYVPMYKRKRYNRFTEDRIEEIRPLFPSYVFARFSVKELYHKVRFTRGVRTLVCFDERPAVVDDEIIALIQSKQDTHRLVTIPPQYSPVDEVAINTGPLQKLTAIFERAMSDGDRVVLLLQAVDYQARIIVNADCINKVEKA